MKFTTRLLTAAMATALALGLGAGAADAQALDRILKEKKIRITDASQYQLIKLDPKQ